MTNDSQLQKKEEAAHDKAVGEIQAAEKKVPTALLTEKITRQLAIVGMLLIFAIALASVIYLLASENDSFDKNGVRTITSQN